MKKKQRRHVLQRIRELTLAGIKQTHISKILNITDPTVRRYQRLAGLLTRPHVNRRETEIMELYRAGWSGVAIAKRLGISLERAYKVAHQNNFPLGTGRPPKKHDAGEALHTALDLIDRAFGDEPLPFGPEHDAATAAALLGAAAQRYPALSALYARSSETDLAEFCGLLTQALHVKRSCSDQGTVH